MRHYALIGYPLTHSLSKELFDRQHFADADYRLCPMPSLENLREWVAREHIDGFNVTSPHKQTLLPLLDDLSPEACAIGAVNCVRVEEGRLIGHNTDAPAFRDTLVRTKNFRQALILGTGGAARAVAYALDQLGIPYLFVSRTPEKHPDAIGYEKLSTFNFQLSTLIVNATPVGTYPDINRSPLASDHWPPTIGLVYDLVYNPSPSLLLQQASAADAAIQDGLAMLHRQAELSWEIWGLASDR
ncbi:MAG: shikimate dehydrogenase [Bacteroidales bacterium]|nr:shikimate dehydrogenase [Bacteroidales bacterium]